MEYVKERWAHQRVGEERAFELYLKAKEQNAEAPNFGYGLFFEPGTGKTFTAINILRRVVNHEKRHLRTLIFAPPAVCPNWKEEFKKFSNIEPKMIHVLHSEGKRRLKIFRQVAFDSFGERLPQIFITNYEALTGKPGSALDEFFHEVLKWQPQFLILDESHRIKSIQAKRTKQIDIIANPSDPRTRVLVPRPLVLALSGSPILNSPMDLFSQFLALDGGETFGSNFFAFRARYFRDKNANMPSQRRFPHWVPKPGALERIQTAIAKRSMVVYKKDCLDLPPLVNQKIFLQMTEAQSRHYEEMKKQLVTYLGSDACVAQLAITKALRLLQISSGFIRTEDGQDISLGVNPKKEALADLLEDLAIGHKVIVWAVFKQDYLEIRDVCGRLKLPFVALHGGLTSAKRTHNVKAFNEDPKVRVLIGHPRSGGIGINLTASDYSIYYSRTFSLEDRIQSEARNYRGGSDIHQKITHVDLVMKDTIEEKVLSALDTKTEIGLSILRDLMVSSKSLGGLPCS